jgi:hypothetical protein
MAPPDRTRLKGLDEMPRPRRTARQVYFRIRAKFIGLPDWLKSTLKLTLLVAVVWGGCRLADIPIEQYIRNLLARAFEEIQ